MFELTPYSTRRSMMDPFNFFSDFFGTNNAPMELRTDITDKGDSFVLEADLPGFKKDDIKIDLENDRLTIMAERHSNTETTKNGYVRRERSFGSFERSFDVSGIDTAGIKANYTDGVLTLTLPKRPELVPDNRSIVIE
ncbi:MAG: Hsp20/alpha crystallin family protein [Oscillospiraceae bacterium]